MPSGRKTRLSGSQPRITSHDRNARRRPVAHLHRHCRNRQLHQGRRSREQDPVGRLDADEAAGGAARAARSSRATAAPRSSPRTASGCSITRAASSSSTSRRSPPSPTPNLSGRVRLGVPDDYADRYLPEIMARFSRAYPGVELTVICEPSVDLLERIDANEIDLAIITNCDSKRASETFRRERLLWVTSNRHSTHLEERMPLALGRPSCGWRRTAIERARERSGGRIASLYSSANAGAVAAAVLVRPRGVGVSGVGPAARHARAQSGRWISLSCRPAASDSCAIRTKARRWPTRSPSTSSLRSTTCRMRRRRRSSHVRARCA